MSSGRSDHLYALLPGKAAVHAGELDAREGDEEIAVHHAVHDVGVTDEVGDKGVLGLVVDVLGGADLLHLAAVHDDDGVGHGQGLFLVVGDVDEGDVHLALQALEFQLHLLAQLEVQGAQRLVEKQDLSGSLTRLRAMATRCCWPPDIWPMLRRSKPFRPTTSSISRTLRRWSLRPSS